MADIGHTFEKARHAFAALHPELSGRLSAPASAGKIDSFEDESGIQLPEAIRSLYLQADGCCQSDGLFGGWEWLPLDFVKDHLAELQMSLESDRPEEAEAMSLVPLFHSNGDYLCIRRQEVGGGLYYVPHDYPTVELVSESLAGFLEQFVARIDAGALVLSQFSTPRGTYFSVRPPTREYWPPDFE